MQSKPDGCLSEELSVIDWEDIDKDNFKNPAYWNNTTSEDAVTSASGGDMVNIMCGAREQGTYSALFDLFYTFIAITSPGITDSSQPWQKRPDLSIFEAKPDIRVRDFGPSQRHKIGILGPSKRFSQ
ncbi:hypothetical protein Forpe1208_v011046 [Fusarium oxysporum f. sp. rapae]|uniref:Uncharacterized protein n=1 Tax=Fusarium oxysporum f. sp. rapae TaxID=485398 RepID=A0A8J5NZC6_FUSOX|nr:hypothetical protein Forpe1208_v011046 [Fusarium oxysporum f. sp. rapae]